MNTIHLKIRLFASCAEAAGRKEMRLTVEGGTTLSKLKDRLASSHPRLKSMYPSIIFAVNDEVKKQDTVLRDGDEVALLPPVSGGKRGDWPPCCASMQGEQKRGHTYGNHHEEKNPAK